MKNQTFFFAMTRFSKALLTLSAALLVFTAASVAYAAGGPRVFFKNLKDGENVTSPVKVEMGVEGMSLAKAGSTGAQEGHHHLIVDGTSIAKGEVIPSDATHLHFGQAQTETNVELTPGKHTLTLQFADGLHRSFGPDLSSTVTVNVVPK